MPLCYLDPDAVNFPDPHLAEESGLLAVGGGLSPHQLVQAYSQGIFPWYDAGSPLLWWSPSPRCCLLPSRLHIPRSLQRTLRRLAVVCTLDSAFKEVIDSCRSSRPQEGTWLQPEMIEAYVALHQLGFAHSVEVWHKGQLAGGLYGVSLGGAFFGESMFYAVPEASKIAVVFLTKLLAHWKFVMLDCQQTTAHMMRFGAESIPRLRFMKLLEKALKIPTLQKSWAEHTALGMELLYE